MRLSDRHLMTIGEAIASHALVTGGSGVALGLPENFRRAGLLGSGGRSFASTSERARRRSRRKLLDRDARADRACVETLAEPKTRSGSHRGRRGRRRARSRAGRCEQPENAPVLIYGSAPPEEVKAVQARYGREKAGAMMEETLGKIAAKLVAGGARRMIVAGGETAGAVVSSLGIEGLKIGREIDPGVPWTESIGEPKLALALKSGNFGGVDFFSKAFGMLS